MRVMAEGIFVIVFMSHLRHPNERYLPNAFRQRREVTLYGWCGSKMWVANGAKRQRTDALPAFARLRRAKHDLAEQPSSKERSASWSAVVLYRFRTRRDVCPPRTYGPTKGGLPCEVGGDGHYLAVNSFLGRDS
jgi:hypothetical protein